MKEQELFKKRLLDLSRQADNKDIVIFSDFLNLNELNIYHTIEKQLLTKASCFGGYSNAERQMIAFIPDALCYEYRTNNALFQSTNSNATCIYEQVEFHHANLNYPIKCIRVLPKHPQYAEKLTHRDILGALMGLGIDRSKLGDILCFESEYYIFCTKTIFSFILEQLSQIRHTAVTLSEELNFTDLQARIQFEERYDMIASNRMDCIVAKACHLSRNEASALFASEKVFMNGKIITNANQSCPDGGIVSVRGKTRFIFESCNTTSKKGKLRVKFSFYK